MILDDTLATAVGTSTVGIVVALWLQVRAQIKDLRGQLSDAVGRIRELESARIEDSKGYSIALRDLATKVMGSINNATNVSRRLVEILRGRPCLLDRDLPRVMPCADNLPDVDTEALERKAQE